MVDSNQDPVKLRERRIFMLVIEERRHSIVAIVLIAGGYGPLKGRQATYFFVTNPSTDHDPPQPNFNGSQTVVFYHLCVQHGTGAADGILPDVELLRLELQQHPTEEVERKVLKLSVTVSGKEGKSKMIASCGRTT